MLFNSWQYAVFLPLVFLIYWAVPHKFRWIVLLISSYYFYMSWNVKYVVLIVFTTVISYAAGILIKKTDTIKIKKGILAFTVISCLGLLFVFKYLNFIFDSLNYICQRFAIPYSFVELNILLPVGISFYTFQTLSYVIDVYRGTCPVEKNLGIYATFISFFPQLVAGPIERSTNLMPQINSEKRFDYDMAMYGIKLLAVGLFKKIVIADNIAVFVDKVYADVYSFSGFTFILAAFFFTVQLYCDFSGYSDIARGSAKLLGINLMENFKSPFFSHTLQEFWHRWHISLSTWFKDYLYIPLGGSRCSKAKSYRNLLITFLASGLWHGANWNMLIWGGVHGLIQVFERIFKIKISSRKPVRIIQAIITFIIVVLAFIFFRCQTFSEAVFIFTHIFENITSPSTYLASSMSALSWIDFGKFKLAVFFLLYTLPLFIYDYYSAKLDVISLVTSLKIQYKVPIYTVFVVLLALLACNSAASFVYFQF